MGSEHRPGVVIAGGGYVGLSLAAALKQAAPALPVTVADAGPGPAADRRASAVAAAARRMLTRLGVWEAIAPEAQPITEMTITDSRADDRVRPVFLTFAGPAGDGEPFAWMVPNRVLTGALERAAVAAGVTILRPQSVTDFSVRPESVTAALGDGATLAAAVLVAADGVRSRLRSLAGIPVVRWEYGQSGIVATVRHERPHGGRAEEHFLPAGPFAVLPLTGNRASLVWTEPTATAEWLAKADDQLFRAELQHRFGNRLGPVEPEGPRHAYPLGLTLARRFAAPRLALCGDAAHGIHPIAGQGLNLGFKDAAALAEVLAEAFRLGLDLGSPAVLERYERWRRFETVEMAATTDVLNRLFSNDNPAVRLARDIGLGLVDRLPGLKRRFIARAAGEDGGQPRLLAGEAI